MKIPAFSCFLPLLGLIGCAAEPPAEQASAAAAGASVECIDQSRIAGRHPAGPGSILFEMAGGVNYRNDLPGRCPDLERADQAANITIVDSDGTRLCRNDSVRIIEPGAASTVGAGAFPKCRLGPFTPVASR
jgi:hypothetical protein